jgi:hypothetical protein
MTDSESEAVSECWSEDRRGRLSGDGVDIGIV